MKRIVIDLYKTKNLYSGLGQFSLNFAKELASRGMKDLDFRFLVPKPSPILPSEGFNLVSAGFRHRYLPAFAGRQDLWHSLQQFPSHLPARSSLFILTVHDLNFLTEKEPAKARQYLRRLQKNVDRADIVTAISEFTKNEIEQHIDLKGKRVKVIYNGISAGDPKRAARPAFADDRPFFFAIGLFTAKKNFHVLLPLMKHFPGHRLIIAGDHDNPYGREILAQVSALGLTGQVILPGKIHESARTWLYRNCEAFLFPSLAEGFGMPVIEAMSFGKPVFLSRYGSLPEIGGGAAFYFDDFADEKMAALINEKLTDPLTKNPEFSERLRQHASRFSWKACIDQYIGLYKELLTSF